MEWRKYFRTGQRWWRYDIGNVLNGTESFTKMVNSVLCEFHLDTFFKSGSTEPVTPVPPADPSRNQLRIRAESNGPVPILWRRGLTHREPSS